MVTYVLCNIRALYLVVRPTYYIILCCILPRFKPFSPSLCSVRIRFISNLSDSSGISSDQHSSPSPNTYSQLHSSPPTHPTSRRSWIPQSPSSFLNAPKRPRLLGLPRLASHCPKLLQRKPRRRPQTSPRRKPQRKPQSNRRRRQSQGFRGEQAQGASE